MKKNMGILDTKIRIAFAVVIAILYFTGTISGFYGIVILAAAVLLVLTGLVRFCPLYALFDFNTLKK